MPLPCHPRSRSAKPKRCWAIAATLAIVTLGAGTARAREPDLELARRTLERLEQWGFSGVVLVAHGDQILFTAAAGRVDSTPSRITSETRFDVASLSKLVTATLAFSLAADGTVDLTQPIAKLIPTVPQDKASITPLDLLGHTSGLPREVLEDYVPVARDSLVALVLAAQLRFEPGTRVHYSNSGYALLAAWLEIATDTPFADLVRRRVFDVAGMNSSGFQGAVPGPAPVASIRSNRRGSETPSDWNWTWGNRGPGGLVSTVGDWHRLLTALRHDRFGPEVLARMTNPTRPARGYGLIADRQGDGLEISHSGLWYGFTSMFVVGPDSISTIVFSNGSFPGDFPARLAADLVRRALDGDSTSVGPMLRQNPTGLGAALAGTYTIDANSSIELIATATGFTARVEGQAAWNLMTWSDPNANQLTRRLATETEEILSGVEKGDFTRLDATAPPDRAARYRQALPRIWQQRTDSLGAVRAIEILGTGPAVAADDLLETRARIRYARGTEEVVLIWSNDVRLEGLINGNPPERHPLLAFREAPDGSFVSWNPATRSTARVLLHRTADGITVERPRPGGAIRVAARKLR